MYEPIKVERRQVDAVVRATFPEYRGRKFKIDARGAVSLQDLNWSGGTRSQYRASTLEGRYLGGMDRFNQMWPGDNIAEGKTLPVPAGTVVVRHCMFCGKDLGLTIFANPADLPKLLPGPQRPGTSLLDAPGRSSTTAA